MATGIPGELLIVTVNDNTNIESAKKYIIQTAMNTESGKPIPTESLVSFKSSIIQSAEINNRASEMLEIIKKVTDSLN